MNKRTPVPGYRLLSSPSTKLKLKDNHYQTPCSSQYARVNLGYTTDSDTPVLLGISLIFVLFWYWLHLIFIPLGLDLTHN